MEVEHLMDVFRASFRANLCWYVHSAATVASPYTLPIRLSETSLGLKGWKCLVSEVVNCLSLVQMSSLPLPSGTAYRLCTAQDSRLLVHQSEVCPHRDHVLVHFFPGPLRYFIFLCVSYMTTPSVIHF